jgi:hypothetical protein
MATSDMSLGGGAGFGAGYTPIRFAPLVSLTGPVMAPATPAAPEAAAPMLRLPMMADQGGGYETPQRTDAAFQNLQPIGDRLETPEGRAAELQNLGRGLSFLASPLLSTGSLLATGKLPLEYVLGEMGGAAQPGASGQGTPAAPFGGFLQGLQNLRDSFARNVFGQEEVPLFETRAPLETAVPSMVFDGGLYSVTPDLAPIDQTNALFNDPAFYNAIVAGVPVGQMQQSNMAPILDALNQSILQGTSTMEQFGPQFTGGGGFGQTNESSSYGSDFGGGNVADNWSPGISYDISDFR